MMRLVTVEDARPPVSSPRSTDQLQFLAAEVYRLAERLLMLASESEEHQGRAPVRSALYPASTLTHREREVGHLLARGLSNRQIAAKLVITEKTTRNHVHRVLDKLGVHSRAEVAARSADFGLRN